MAEQSHREEMNAAIRAQRERSLAPKTIAPAPHAEPPPQPDEPSQPDPARRRFRRRRS